MGRRGKRVSEYATAGNSTIEPQNLSEAIEGILGAYADEVFQATETGLDMAETILVKRMKDASPKKSGTFRNSWKGTKRKYTGVRFVGNTKSVRSKGRNIPLINIFEYSTTNHANPFVKQTFESSMNEMANAIINEIKK